MLAEVMTRGSTRAATEMTEPMARLADARAGSLALIGGDAMGQSFTFGELFSGPGGMALGAHQAAGESDTRLVHAWANDYDADAVSTYIANIPGASPHSVQCQDVRKLDLQELERVDGFAFGFPCNDYSLVGESLGLNGNFGPLFSYGVEILELQQPKWFIAENVSGLRASNGGSDFPKILEAMRSAGRGYKLTPHLYR
jgi:DNA (cytosine-5)-methyltransferase 1